MQVWTLHNAARYAFVGAARPVVMFDFDNCEHLSEGIETIDEVRPACSWFYFAAGSRVKEKAARWAAEITDLVIKHGGGNRRIAIDHVDPEGAQALEAHSLSLYNGQEVLEQARCIKSSVEIDAIKSAIAVCEQGMRRMQEALQPGVTENESWSILHQTNIALGGEWIETRLLTSGPRTNPWFQECSDRVIEPGDLVSFDTDLIGPRGYCADISRSWICGDGKPKDAQRRLYAMAYEQIQHNTAQLKPGVSFCEYLEKSFKLPQEYTANRYSAVIHGVGLCDEYPHIPYAQDMARSGYDGTLEENMTVCVESYIGAVDGRAGVKLEEQVLIGHDGPVTLSSYPFEETFL
jgi:Xaa-Pro aminopeptidase